MGRELVEQAVQLATFRVRQARKHRRFAASQCRNVTLVQRSPGIREEEPLPPVVSIAEQGQNLAALIFFLQDVHSLGLKATQGTYLTTASYWDLDEPSRAWSKQFMERAGMMPSMLHAGVYGSVVHYLKAIKQAGTDDPDKVAAAMKAMPINDAFTKDAKIRADGRVLREMYLARVKKPADSRAPWDDFEIVRKIAPEATVWPLSESKCAAVTK